MASPTGPLAARLPNRGVLAVGGTDRVAFLQGLVSADVTKVAPGAPAYACLLTPQGKFLHDMLIVADADRLLLETEGARVEELMRRLRPYKLRSDVSFAVENDRWQVWAVWDESPRPLAGEGGAHRASNGRVRAGEAGAFTPGTLTLPALAGWAPPSPVGTGEGFGPAFTDPRTPALGWRVLTAPNAPSPTGTTEVTPDLYDRHRTQLAAPDGSRDMAVSQDVLLELGIDRLNGIAWDKGCWMGQELTARTRYRGLVKKRLVPVAIEGPAPAFGAVLTLDGHEVGEMRSSVGDIGLALVRLAALEAGGMFAAGDAVLRVLDTPVRVAEPTT